MTKNDGMQVGGGGFDLLSRLGHGDSLHKEARAEIERLKRYSLIVESYLDRETLKEVLTKYRATPDGRTLEPGGSRETVWLIEHKNGGWVHGNPDHEDGYGWSNDPNRAIRFSRKIDAKWAMARLGFFEPLHFASEHLFVESPQQESGLCPHGLPRAMSECPPCVGARALKSGNIR